MRGDVAFLSVQPDSDRSRGLAVGQSVGQELAANPLSLEIRVHGKTDDEMRTQAQGMNRLGKELVSLGMTLAYHHHSTAMYDNARELHHVLGETDPGRILDGSIVATIVGGRIVHRAQAQ